MSKSAPADRVLTILISVGIEGEGIEVIDEHVTIPPGYDAADVNALIRRHVEDLACAHSRRFHGGSPTREAIRAGYARLEGIREAIERMPRRSEFAEHIARLRAALVDLSNADVIARWGADDPEG